MDPALQRRRMYESFLRKMLKHGVVETGFLEHSVA